MLSSWIYCSSLPQEALLEEDLQEVINNENSTLKTLRLNLVENGLDNNAIIDWDDLGRLIGTHSSLKEVNIDGYDILWKDKAKCSRFFDNISTSESIDNIVIMNVKSPDMLSISLFNNTLCSLTLIHCDLGIKGYNALAMLLKNTACKLEALGIIACDFDTESSVSTIKNALKNNSTVKRLRIYFPKPLLDQRISATWALKLSSVEDLTLIDRESIVVDEGELAEMGDILGGNTTTLKMFKVGLGPQITTEGWDTFFFNFMGNHTLEYLDLSGHDNISVPNLMSALTNNSTLKTLNLEYLFADFNGLRWVANFLKSPKCALENIYLEGNHEGGAVDSLTFKEFTAACMTNRTLKNLYLKLPRDASEMNTPEGQWYQVMKKLAHILFDMRSINKTYDSNHILESICYPHKEERFRQAMSACSSMARMLPHHLTMNWEADKSKVARKKIMIAHYFQKDIIRQNKEHNSEYKTLIETIVGASNDMQSPEQLPNMMAWVGRETDGLSAMYDLMKKMPTLCEGSSSKSAQRCKRKLSALEIECEAFQNGELGSFSP